MSPSQRINQIGRPVADSDLWWAAELAQKIGVSRAARCIGIARGTLASVIAGLPVAATTEYRVREARAKLKRITNPLREVNSREGPV